MDKDAMVKMARTLDNVIRASQQCLDSLFVLPSVILAYSAIDTLGWLDMPSGKEYNTKNDFMAWVDKYLLPNAKFECTAIDLYGGRCAMLHTTAPASRLSEEGAAKLISYSWGNAKGGVIEQTVAGTGRCVTIYVRDLLDAIRAGIVAFAKDLEADPERCRTVLHRAKGFYDQW